MHAHDRTLLASLGFADPDKRNPLHDFACQYLALRENHERIAGMVAPLDAPGVRSGRCFPEKTEYSRGRQWEWTATESQWHDLDDPVLEFPVSKGSGQYKRSIGFIDVMLPCDIAVEWRGTSRLMEGGKVVSERPYKDYQLRIMGAFVEVKIGRASVGDVLRQIVLYREHLDIDNYWDDPAWLLATPYQLDRTDKASLELAGVRHILLGEKFHRWAEERMSAPQFADSPEL